MQEVPADRFRQVVEVPGLKIGKNTVVIATKEIRKSHVTVRL
jgi:hypothetical protein